MSENTNTAESTESVSNPSSQAPEAPNYEAQLKEKEDKYLYLYADFENYKKRAIKERSDAQKFGWESVARDLLLVLDNLDRALHFATPGTDPNLIAGLQLVAKQFKETLERKSVQVIPSINQVFNPELHEAVGQEPSDLPSGTIVREEQKGYTLHGRLLRAARVVISTGPKS